MGIFISIDQGESVALRVQGREVEVQGRQHINMAEIFNDKNKVLVRSKGIFIAVDPEKMFAKYVGK